MESNDNAGRRSRVTEFLGRLAGASRDDWALASSMLAADLIAWEAAGGRARRHLLEMGLADLCKKLEAEARIIARAGAAFLEPPQLRRRATWAAQSAVVGLVAYPDFDKADLRHLCSPFASLMPPSVIQDVHLGRQPIVGSTTHPANLALSGVGYCPEHGVPLSFGGCHVCRRKSNQGLNKLGGASV